MSPPSPDAILHLASLHLLSQAGFPSTSRAASLTLSSLAARYIRLVALASADKATLAGRSKVGALDVVSSLEDLGAGYGIEELGDWLADQGGGAGLQIDGLDELGDYLETGLGDETHLLDMELVDQEDLEGYYTEEEDEDASQGGGIDEDDAMDIDVKHEEGVEPDLLDSRYRLTFDPPDLSWLPPLPNASEDAKPNITSISSDAIHRSDPMEESKPTAAAISATAPETGTALAAPISIVDRYSTVIPFASSSLASRPGYSLPSATLIANLGPLPPSTSSLPALLAAYAATEGDPSISLRQNDLRRQALDLYRRQVAAPDKYALSGDSLSLPDNPPGPRISPIVPSHSDSLPPQLIPLNPNPQTPLSQLVHAIQSPYLPPGLRERLTSLRPPVALKRDGQPILYGPPIRGPDGPSLAKALGKQPATEGPESKEAWLYATWDAGPKGQDKWSKGKLPSGKKVIRSGQGEEVPRTAAAVAALASAASVAGALPVRSPGGGDAGAGTGVSIKIRPPQAGESSSGLDTNMLPPPLPSPRITIPIPSLGQASARSISPNPSAPSPRGTQPTALRIKLPDRSQNNSFGSASSTTGASTSPSAGTPVVQTQTPGGTNIKLKFNAKKG